MINFLILLAGAAIVALSIFFGILVPLRRGRASGRRDGVVVPAAHVLRGFAGAIVGGLIVVAGLSQPFVEVPAGNVGVVTNFGSVQSGTLQPGLHVVTPIVQLTFYGQHPELVRSLDGVAQTFHWGD